MSATCRSRPGEPMDADTAHETDGGAALAALPPRARWRDGDYLLALQIAVSALTAFVVTGIWAATSHETFWPLWVWFAFGVLLVPHVVVRSVRAAGGLQARLFRLHATVSGSLIVMLVVIWAAAGGGWFWPFIPSLVLGALLALHAMV